MITVGADDCFGHNAFHIISSIAVEAEAGAYGGSPNDVKALFSSAKQNGINVIRFFPFGILETFTLQTAPGVKAFVT